MSSFVSSFCTVFIVTYLTGKKFPSVKIYGFLIEDTIDFVLFSSERLKYKQARLRGKLSVVLNYTRFVTGGIFRRCGMKFCCLTSQTAYCVKAF